MIESNYVFLSMEVIRGGALTTVILGLVFEVIFALRYIF